MRMQGERRIHAQREAVWSALNDPAVLKSCIAGCKELDRTGADSFAAKLTAQVGPVKANFSGNVMLENITPPESYIIRGEGKGGAAGFAKGAADIRLTQEGDITLIRYTLDAKVGGKLAQIGSRLIEASATKMADDFFNKFTAIVASPQTTSKGSETPDKDGAAADETGEAASEAGRDTGDAGKKNAAEADEAAAKQTAEAAPEGAGEAAIAALAEDVILEPEPVASAEEEAPGQEELSGEAADEAADDASDEASDETPSEKPSEHAGKPADEKADESTSEADDKKAGEAADEKAGKKPGEAGGDRAGEEDDNKVTPPPVNDNAHEALAGKKAPQPGGATSEAADYPLYVPTVTRRRSSGTFLWILSILLVIAAILMVRYWS